ncbi:MAG TPA: septal ring lytic transglycosylase RlpA family protein [Gemmatimonadota bacterium]|nr:septal ring lytic transglycosylase RlpA family protein [Gemmatimonadota bacterium]
MREQDRRGSPGPGRAASASVFLLAACAAYPAPAPMESVTTGWQEEGEASWYGPGFHGRQTASGEVYDMEAMTAAHRELPFGSRVRVVNLDNGRETHVRINDRGPFARGRVLDLSRAAAREIDMLGSGTARVRIEVLEGVAEPTVPAGVDATVSIPEGCTLVQVGAFAEHRNAAELTRRLEARGEPVRQVRGSDGLVRVLVGPFATENETRRMLERFDGNLRPCEP